MAVNDNKRYYWLKLHKDFFKQHEITIIEDMPNGKDYILFYLKLLVESVSHEGQLRFSETIPYNEQMLASLTKTNIDVVRNAMRIFVELQMIEILDDQTIFMLETEKMIGSETGMAKRMREYRLQSGNNVTKSIEYRDKNKEILTKVSTKKGFKKPTLEEVKDYCKERNSSVNPETFYQYYEAGDWKDSQGNPVRNWKQKLITWEKKSFKSDNKIPDFTITKKSKGNDLEEIRKRMFDND